MNPSPILLCLDAGNTRLKWGLFADDDQGLRCLLSATFDYDHLNQATALWHSIKQAAAAAQLHILPNRLLITGACVTTAERQAAIEAALPCAVLWRYSESYALGMRNTYQTIATHGADRWLAALGARHHYPSDKLLVVLSGTAMTVDAISAANLYLGGAIMPGYRTMHQALVGQTAQLPLAAGEVKPQPLCTVDAIATGLAYAMIGCITQMQTSFAAVDYAAPTTLILSGGDAPTLAAWLASMPQASAWFASVVQHEDLVLWGLACRMRALSV
jgi:type III pantothenate kinase